MLSRNEIQGKLIDTRDAVSNAWRRLIEWMLQLLHLRGSKRSGNLAIKDGVHDGANSAEQEWRNDASLEVNRILVRLRYGQKLTSHGDLAG
jgi:hypothetical protein